jgi:hypothetical protein
LYFFKSYVASYGYVCRPGTDRIPEGVKKKLRRNRNPDSCGKSATGTEKTGIWRIPAGIGNLGPSNDDDNEYDADSNNQQDDNDGGERGRGSGQKQPWQRHWQWQQATK